MKPRYTVEIKPGSCNHRHPHVSCIARFDSEREAKIAATDHVTRLQHEVVVIDELTGQEIALEDLQQNQKRL